MKVFRKIFSALALMVGVGSMTVGFLLAMANEGARMVPDGFPLDQVAPWFILGIIGLFGASLVWPHPRGLKQYFRDIL